jgi:hypothetical protein
MNGKNTLPKFGIAAKDIFHDLIYSSKSFTFPEIEPRIAKQPPLFLSKEFIAVYNYMFYQMYRNRTKLEYQHQEICHQSYSTIAKWSRVSVFSVQDAIFYGVRVGILHSIEQLPKKKGKYCPGVLIYEFNSYKLSTNKNLRCGTPQLN